MGGGAVSAEGGCICGAVRYRLLGQPTNSMICHCRSCRRAAAAPVVAWVTLPKSQFVLLQGSPAAVRTSDPVRRTFCASCGTPLTYEHRDAPDTIDVTTCSLDDADAFPPTHHSYVSHDPKWVRFGDGLAAFAEWPPKKP